MPGRRHALGQHFLRDAAVVGRILDLAGLEKGTEVLEIGPGRGALTFPLLDAGYRVTAVEFDRMLAESLQALQRPGLRVLHADFLRLDLDALPATPMPVVANLPYSTGTAIVTRLLEHSARFPRLVVMLQKEVAARLAAAPGSRAYGSLSIFTQLHAEVGDSFQVPPAAFRPPPKVDSSVVRLDARSAPRVALRDDALFRRVVLAGFATRRKTLRNALGAAFGKPAALAALDAAGIDPMRRAETLSIEEFAQLSLAFVASN